jgi:hypothetical protein
MPSYKRLLATASALLWATSGFAQPTDNPVLTAFPASDAFYIKGKQFGNYAWTDDINWSTVYDVTTDLTLAPFTGLSNVTKDDLPPNHPNADHDDITGDASDDLATVNAAISQLSALGGGVLYFPAGIYVFSDNIVLKDGVVLRGADPTGVTDARTTGYNPPTDFFFPRLPGIVDDADVPQFGKRMDPSGVAASSVIGGAYTNPADVPSKMLITKKVEIDQTYPAGLTATNYGIVNVDLFRAGVQFLQEFQSNGTIDRFSVTFGSGDKNRMEGGNVVVYGNRLNNVVDLEWLIAQDADFNSWQLWMNRVGPHIDVMVKENSIVANNRINDMEYEFRNGSPLSNTQPYLLVDSFGMAVTGDDNSGVTGDPDTDYTNPANVYLDRSGNIISGNNPNVGVNNSNNKYVLFRHSQGLGIAVNRSSRVGYGSSGPHTPAGEPSLQRQGNVVRQNWLYITNRVGYQLSGFGLEVRDNVRVDINGDAVVLGPTGDRYQTNNSATYENRGFDVTGDNIFVNNNEYTVYNRTIANAGFPTVDGEGILIQQNDGQLSVNNWTVANNTGNRYIGLFKLRSMRNVSISNNTVTGGNIQILANPNFFPGETRNLTLNNNSVSGGVNWTAGLLELTSTSVITNNSGGTITLPDYDNSVLSPSTLLNDSHYVLFGNTASVAFSDSNAGIAASATDFPLDNLINPAPEVKIITPALGQVLTAGVPITVQVEVNVDSSAQPSIGLASVTLYDASQLGADQQLQLFAYRTDANALLGATTLSFNAGTGYYEASWTPTTAFLDYGLLAVEAVMDTQTVKDGVSDDPAIDRNFTDFTIAMIGIEEGKVFTAGDPAIVITSGTDPTLSFDMAPGGTYMLQKRNSLTGGDWEYVTGQIVTNGNSKTTGVLTDAGALPTDPQTFYRVVER